MRLIADIGGTNARLALSNGGKISKGSSRSYANAEWNSLYAVIADFQSQIAGPVIAEVVVAVAGPVQGNRAALTNFNWDVDATQLAALTGAHHVRILNDLTALGYATPNLQSDQLTLVRSGEAKQGSVSQSLVVGIGTGFNVSPVLQNKQHVICPAVEAGHLAMPQSITMKVQKLGLPPELFPTIESLFSGDGLTTFCRQLARQPDLTGSTAIAAYGDTARPQVTHAIDQYATLLGILLQDVSLAYMPSAGIYLAGSVARALISVAAAPCMRAFGQNTSTLVHPGTPVWSINDDLAALTGCAEYAL